VRTVVIGVGNLYRSDDGAGPEVARILRHVVPEGVDVVESGGEAEAIVNAWEGADLAIIVDVLPCSSLPAGQVDRIEVGPATPFSSCAPPSTHALGPEDAVALGGAVGQLPRRLIVYAIGATRFDLSVGLSPEVEAATQRFGEEILAEVKV
jgi:hydrogenase maturation protease